MKVRATLCQRFYYKVELEVPDGTPNDEIDDILIDYYGDDLPDPVHIDLDVYDSHVG